MGKPDATQRNLGEAKMMTDRIEYEQLLTPGEVAKRFHVYPKTVGRWAAQGKLTAVRTPGGHRRYLSSEVARFLGRPDAT